VIRATRVVLVISRRQVFGAMSRIARVTNT
jgi:hypothetical protein